jgi:hypothetical protein
VTIACYRGSGHGPEIPREIRSRLFEPFVAASEDLGLGLGLALSRQTLLDHGGEMWTKPAVGARFVVSLPLKKNEDAPAQTAGKNATLGGKTLRVHGLRIRRRLACFPLKAKSKTEGSQRGTSSCWGAFRLSARIFSCRLNQSART